MLYNAGKIVASALAVNALRVFPSELLFVPRR